MTGSLSAASNTSGVNAALAYAPASSQSRVDQAIDRIQDLISDNGFLGTSRNGQMKEIADLLGDLSPSERNAVIAGLSDADLAALAEDVNAGGIFGADGLSTDEKRDLFTTLAQGLDGDQLSRLSQAFNNHDDAALMGEAIASHASDAAKIDYVEAQAAHLTDNPTEVSGSSTLEGDADAVAVVKVMGSLSGANMDAAIKALSPAQLDAVVQSGLGQVSKVSSSGMSIIQTHDATDLRTLLDAAATTGVGAEQKAALFRAAGDALGELGGDFNVTSPDVGETRQTISQGLTALVNSDTNGVIGALEKLDRDGGALSAYATEVLKHEGGEAVLGEHLARVRNGEDKSEVAFDRFSATDADGNYKNAQNLGYLSGAIQAGVDDAVAAGKDKADLIGGIFSKLIGLATSRLPPGASQVADVVTEQTIEALKDQATSSGLAGEFAALAYPTDSAGAPYEGERAETAYDAAVGRVLDAQR